MINKKYIKIIGYCIVWTAVLLGYGSSTVLLKSIGLFGLALLLFSEINVEDIPITHSVVKLMCITLLLQCTLLFRNDRVAFIYAIVIGVGITGISEYSKKKAKENSSRY